MLESLEWPPPKTLPPDCSEVEIVLIGGERRVTIFHETFEFGLKSDGSMCLARRRKGLIRDSGGKA